ncbi:hypothetical protein ACEPPN_015243 [Leptodophora sp. 'Broadleaf-Isolate-01']
MGAEESAEEKAAAWREKQSDKGEYTVDAATSLRDLAAGPKGGVKAFLEKGDGGVLWVGNNPYYPGNDVQEIDIQGWECRGEGDVSVVFVRKT